MSSRLLKSANEGISFRMAIIFFKALKIKEEKLGKDHTDTATVIYSYYLFSSLLFFIIIIYLIILQYKHKGRYRQVRLNNKLKFIF